MKGAGTQTSVGAVGVGPFAGVSSSAGFLTLAGNLAGVILASVDSKLAIETSVVVWWFLSSSDMVGASTLSGLAGVVGASPGGTLP